MYLIYTYIEIQKICFFTLLKFIIILFRRKQNNNNKSFLEDELYLYKKKKKEKKKTELSMISCYTRNISFFLMIL